MTANESAPDDRHSLAAVIDRTAEAATGETTRLGDVVEALGHVSHTAVILVPALLAVTPLSGIPGVSSIFGITIALVAAQMVAGRKHLWLPEWILDRKVNSERLKKALGYLRKPAAFVDRHTRRRLPLLIRKPSRTILQAACVLCGLAMPFLELVPFSSSILGAAVSFFAASIVVRDGLLASFGLLFLAGAATLVYQFLT